MKGLFSYSVVHIEKLYLKVDLECYQHLCLCTYGDNLLPE